MPKAKVTVRQLKNIESGIDVAITNCKEETSLLSVKLEYQILVVSNLSCFKTSEHTNDDVVQFVIRRKHDDFVELHRVLGIKYPSVILPAVAPTGMALFQDVNVREQKEGLETFLKRVVSDKDLATSYLTLQFLGVNPIVAGNFQRNKGHVTDSSVKQSIFEEERDDEDLFAAAAEGCGGGSGVDTPDTTDDLFTTHIPTGGGGGGDEGGAGEQSRTARLFDEQDLGGLSGDVNELRLPDDRSTGAVRESDQNKEEEDLLNITDDLDDLLKQTKKKTPNKPSISTKPKLPPKPGGKPLLAPKPGHSLAKKASEKTVEPDLGADDILKYIQEATNQQDEEVDLFS